MTYSNVALHLKGAAGSFRPFDDKPALTLSFSKHGSVQRFHGYSKISLNNSVQDPSYLSEAISRELFEAAGVPVPRADHATVLINGRDLGLYVLTEGWGKPFLRRYFKNVSGNLYDGGFVQDITGQLETNSGDRESDRSDLNRLLESALEPDPARRSERLAQVLDMERFFNFIAMEVMTCHWDGYALNRNNYRVFHDVETDRMVFMPHGLDQMFGVIRSSPHSSIDDPMRGLVARAVLGTPFGRERYLERIAYLRTNVFLEERLTNRVHELSRRIRPTLAAYAPDLAEEHDAQVAYLCQRIVERARSISEQLAAPQRPVQFDDRGMARLSDWIPHRSARRRGVGQLERAERDGRKVLQIGAGTGGGAGAWRTQVLLEAGAYRFEGNVQTRGVGTTGGVSLRIPGTRDVWMQATQNEWSLISHGFTVTQPLVEIELICEMRAGSGEVWFEQDSLRLFRE
ncbi:MAG TPA: CotH kinase family protein [Verrucomicrobiae bacterium]|nr:CotH kinase family protein [Verrucomicrobiae bacterium]